MNARRSFWLPVEMLDEVQEVAFRLVMPKSEVIALAWRLAKDTLRNTECGHPPVESAPWTRKKGGKPLRRGS